MSVSRRALLAGGLLGALGWSFYGLFGRELRPYRSDVGVRNDRTSSVDIELALSDLDEDELVLDRSFALAPDERFRREEILDDETRYRVLVRAGGESTEETFETCCRGYSVSISVKRDELSIESGHYD